MNVHMFEQRNTVSQMVGHKLETGDQRFAAM